MPQQPNERYRIFVGLQNSNILHDTAEKTPLFYISKIALCQQVGLLLGLVLAYPLDAYTRYM